MSKKIIEHSSWRDIEQSTTENKVRRVLVIPDCHHPEIDLRAWNVALEAGAYFQPTNIITLGDFIDCAAVSFHEKDKDQAGLREETIAGNKALDQLDSLGAKTKHFIMGNHEYRVKRYVAQHCPELDGFISVEDLLNLKSRGWGVTQYKDFHQLGKAYYSHDNGVAGKYAHVEARASYEAPIVIGHTHRLASHYSSSVTGKAKVGIMAGWLGSTKKIKYLHAAKVKEWQHGFVTGVIEPNGVTHFNLHPIVNYRVNINGKIIK